MMIVANTEPILHKLRPHTVTAQSFAQHSWSIQNKDFPDVHSTALCIYSK